MNAVKACQARQYSDQMLCPRCGLAWDVNDPDPPSCRKDEPTKKSGHSFARRINQQLHRKHAINQEISNVRHHREALRQPAR